MKVTLPLLGAALLLGGCATMDEDECRTVDWRTIGYEDGSAGYAADRIGQHRQACAKYGIAPDLAAYQAGREQGLREFCQPHNGYRYGANGGIYYANCPADLAPAFENEYNAGHALYVRERRVTDTLAAIQSRRYEITQLESEMTAKMFVVSSSTATPEERTQAMLETKHAAERIGQLKAEIPELEKQRARYQQELDDYRATVAAR